MCFQDYYYAGYVVCFVCLYYFLLSSMSRWLLFLSLIYLPLFYCRIITKLSVKSLDLKYYFDRKCIN